MSNVTIDADDAARKQFNITTDTMAESDAQSLRSLINTSGKGEAVIENGKLTVLTPILG